MKTKKKKNFNTLKKEFSKAADVYSKIRNEFQEEQTRRALPKLKKQYEGKYFKYQNTTGEEKWWLYSYCHKVISQNYAMSDSFEITPYEHEFHVESKTGLHLFQIEIPHHEYKMALLLFISKAKLMLLHTQDNS